MKIFIVNHILFLILSIFILSNYTIFVSCNLPVNSGKITILKDSLVQQKEILTYNGIDSVLNTFEKILFENLPTDYISFAGYDKWYKSAEMKGKLFYKISGSDTLKTLVGHFTIGDFLPKDDVHYKNQRGVGTLNYLSLDTSVIHRLLDLILLLREKKYSDALLIKDGFRYPSFNMRTGGVINSQHQYGNAIDIAIGDVNNDGKYNENIDKKIVIDLFDQKILKNKGGVGYYTGTNVVHFDTRVKYARWYAQ